MKKLSLLLLLLFISSCQFRSTDDASMEPPQKAVYLTYSQGELSSKELKAHPEVILATTFNDFKYYASQKRALWIDRSATPLNPEQEKWINEVPQVYYPIVLVGYIDTLFSFRDLLKLCCFMGPAIGAKPEPGFSIIQWEKTSDPNARTAAFLQGYPEKPTVASILHITNTLLAGNLQTIPSVPSLPAATFTNLP
jgi:hypothetical protein